MTAYRRLPSASCTPVDRSVSAETVFGGPHAGSSDTRPTAAYDLAWINDEGIAARDGRTLPASSVIEAAVSSFARGTLLRGPRGPVSIEDLMPGDRVGVRGGGTARIDWIGARRYAGVTDRPRFYRVAARAFGATGPEHVVLLGAHAHILIDSPRCRDLVGGPLAFAPVAAFEDGHCVTAIAPPGEVSVYGIACAGQEAVLAGGLPVESYHPARATGQSLTRTALADIARLFPQRAGGAGFGAPAVPYLTFAEARSLAVAGV